MALRFGPRSFPLDHHLLVNLPSVRLCRFYSVFRLIRPFSTSSTSPPFSRDNSLHGPESKKLEEKPSHNESITSSTSTEENTSSSPPPFSFEDDDPIRVVESKIIHPSPSPQTTPTSPRQIPELQIVFEDFDFFFVHKPHDWAVSGVGKEKEQQGMIPTNNELKEDERKKREKKNNNKTLHYYYFRRPKLSCFNPSSCRKEVPLSIVHSSSSWPSLFWNHGIWKK